MNVLKWICRFICLALVVAGCAPTGPAEFLSTEERLWLAEHEGTIRYTADPDFPPIAFVEDGKHEGVTAEYLRLIEERLDFKFEYVFFDSWAELITAAQEGRVDVIGDIQDTTARREYLTFTSPFITVPNVIIVRDDQSEDLMPEDMQGMTATIVDGFASSDFVQSEFPHIQLEPVIDTATGLLMVSFGQADAMITDLAVASYFINTLGISNLHVASYIDFQWELTFAVRNELAELQPILQKALDDISPAEQRTIMQNWIHIGDDNPPFFRTILISLLVVLAGGMLVTLVVIAWNTSLRRRVNRQTEALAQELAERKRAEAALLSNQALLKNSQAIAHVGSWHRDTTTNQLFWSDEVYHILGVPPQAFEANDDAFFAVVHPEDRDVVAAAYADSLRSGQAYEIVHRIIRHDNGEVRYVHEKAEHIKDEAGQISTSVGMLHDITDLVRAERAEREQRIFVTTLVEIVEVINSTLDLDTVISRILEAVADVVPHDGSNIMLLTEDRTAIRIVQICECYVANDLQTPEVGAIWPLEELVNLRQMIETGEPLVIADIEAYEEWWNLGTGIRSYIGAPIVREGQVIGFLNVDSLTPNFFTQEQAEHLKAFADQAAIAIQNAQMFQQLASHSGDLERAVIERTAELRAANEELETLSQAKDEFVSNVSHELRTPIAGMRLYHYLLRKRPERMAEYLGVLERETARLEQTIDDLLRLSRLDQGRIAVTLAAVDLNELAKQFVADRTLPAADLGLALRFEQPAAAAVAWADEGLLGQVLSILLTNALNYTPTGGQVTVRTLTRTDAGQAWAGFSVLDTGPGIAPTEQALLFERFYRGTIGQASQVQGTGLGLAIARSIVDLHQGHITVESTGLPGEGTAFTVWLPVDADAID